MNKGCFVIFINNLILKKKKKHLLDLTGHDLLDIIIVHLFTPKFKLYIVLLATKTHFPLSLLKKDTPQKNTCIKH